ncbi:MAG: very short patch repair endonuclease [Thermoplasmatota archaeon]
MTKSSRKRSEKPLLHLYDASKPVSETRSRTMSKIRGKDTKPELILRRALHETGLRYRIHDKSLPGTPDISNKSRKVAIFVDGCFWHGCPEHFKVPKTRTEFWEEKIARNKRKRQATCYELGHSWNLMSFYECELNQLDVCVDKVINAW